MREVLDNNITFCDLTEVQAKFFLLYFTAKWCGPCQMIKPLLYKLSEGFSDDVCEFCLCDIDENSELSDNFKVRAVPTFVLMRGNVFVGETSGSDILKVHALLKQHLPQASTESGHELVED